MGRMPIEKQRLLTQAVSETKEKLDRELER
jgi:hypothetical protein